MKRTTVTVEFLFLHESDGIKPRQPTTDIGSWATMISVSASESAISSITSETSEPSDMSNSRLNTNTASTFFVAELDRFREGTRLNFTKQTGTKKQERGGVQQT